MKSIDNDNQNHFSVTTGCINYFEEGKNLEHLGSPFFDKVIYSLLPTLKEAVLVVDGDNRVVFLNSSCEALIQKRFQAAKGKQVTELFRIYDAFTGEEYYPPHKIDTKESRQGQRRLTYHNMVLKIDNSFHKRISLSVLSLVFDDHVNNGHIMLINDETILHKMEDELVKAQQFTSTRLFIGGIAHDINNIMTCIQGNVALAKYYLLNNNTNYEVLLKKLVIAEKACERAQKISSQLTNYSKEGAPNKELTSIREIVEETASFVCHGSNILCDFDFREQSLHINVDSSQISQVINNLVINAIQSMPNGGKITIRTENYHVDVDSCSTIPLAQGDYLKLTISDEGIGISPEYREKIFEPFYTFKKGGTGLGLTSCKKIITEHQGYIDFDSVEGEGTNFYIYLPAIKTKESTIINGIKKQEYISPATGKILVMDDDQEVKKVIGSFLNLIGYEVVYSSNENETFEQYRRSYEEGKNFSAVILDLTIPGWKGGVEAIKKLLALDKNVNAILATGSGSDNWYDKYKSLGFKALLTKPFGIQNLVDALKEVSLYPVIDCK